MLVSKVDEAVVELVATTLRLVPDRHDHLRTLAFHSRRSMHRLLVEGVVLVLVEHNS